MKHSTICCTALTITAIAAGIGRSQIEIDRFSIDSGGAVRSSGGSFELSGAAAQPDDGILAGGEFSLSGGYWTPEPPGDCNSDGVTGLTDVTLFESCMTGPGGAPPVGTCRCFDVDGTGAIDLADFAVIQNGFLPS